MKVMVSLDPGRSEGSQSGFTDVYACDDIQLRRERPEHRIGYPILEGLLGVSDGADDYRRGVDVRS